MLFQEIQLFRLLGINSVETFPLMQKDKAYFQEVSVV